MAPRHHIITSKFADLMKHPASDEPTIDIVSEKAMIHETLLLEAQNRGFDQELFFFYDFVSVGLALVPYIYFPLA